MLKPPSDGYYRQPLDDADLAMDRNLQGTFLYHDARSTKFRYTASVHGKDKSFLSGWKEDKKTADAPQPSTNLACLYPSIRPLLADEGGWDGYFPSLKLLIGLGFDLNQDNQS